jgi:SNF2 family DNA or RNA helicase
VEALLGLRAPDVSPVVFGPGEGVGFLVGASGDAAALRPRDRAAERRRLRAWLDAAEPPGPWTVVGGGIALDVEATLELLAALRARDDVRVRWRTGERLELSPKKVGPDALRLKVADGMHAYLLTGHLSLGSRQIALGELFEAARRGRRFVEVGAETYAALDAELQASLAAVDAVAREEGSKGQLVPAAAAPRLLELAESAPKAELSPGLEAARARVERSRRLRPEVPSDFRATLRDYQREGFAWALRLAELGLGGCLADDMGLGKTVQALAVLTARADEGPALVVAPTSVMYNWLRDGERFAPGLEPRLYHGPGRTLEGLGPRAVVVTSYGVLLRDIEALAGVRFSTLVLDEAQALKTASSQTAKAARSLSSAFTLALTGTPVENHAGELWSLFEVLAPGLLGTRRSFKARFGATRDGEEDATRRRRLARALRPLVLRRSKQQVLPELPERTEVQIDVVLSKAEQSLYDAVRAKALAGLHAGRGDGPSRVEVLAVLTQLRQLACHPRLLDAGSEVTSSKHARLHELLEELVDEGRQVLVFSQFVRQLDLVAGALDARGVSFERLVGETSVGARLSAVEKFSEGQAPIFLVSLKAGGVGLNLTAADTVIFLDPWWNPAAEAQAADRAHRIGQTKPVTIYRLVARGTLEETVLSLQAEKRRLVEDVLAGTDGAAALDTDALLELLGSD